MDTSSNKQRKLYTTLFRLAWEGRISTEKLNNAIRTNYIQAIIDKTQKNSKGK